MNLDQNLEGLKGVFKIADDVLITGQGEIEGEADEDHDRNLKSRPPGSMQGAEYQTSQEEVYIQMR